MGKKVEVLRATRPMYVVVDQLFGDQLLLSSKRRNAKMVLWGYVTGLPLGTVVFFEVVLGTRSKKRSFIERSEFGDLRFRGNFFCKEGVRHIMGVKNYKRLLQAAKNREYAIIRTKKA